MKRILVFTGFILLTAAACAVGQTRFSIGLRSGLNFGTMSFDPDPFANVQGVTQGGRTGFMVGAVGELEFARMFAPEIGIIYTMKGASFTQGSASEIIKLSELEIPVLFKVKFLSGIIRPYSFVGANVGIILSATDHIESPAGTRDNDLKNNPNGLEISGLDLALDFGGGAELSVGKNFGVLLDVRYSLGLTNIASPGANVAQGATKPSWKASGFQIMVGGMFHL